MYKYIFLFITIFYSCSSEKNSNDKIEEDNKFLEAEIKQGWKYGFDKEWSITFPNKWQIKDSLSTQEIVLNTIVFAENCQDSLNYCSNMILRVIKNEDKQDLEEVVEHFLSVLPQQFETMKIISIKDYQLNDLKLKIVDFRLIQSEINFGNTYAFFLSSDKIFTLFFTGINEPTGRYAEERKKAMIIISSLKKS